MLAFHPKTICNIWATDTTLAKQGFVFRIGARLRMSKMYTTLYDKDC